MDTVNCFKGYGKADEAHDLAWKRKTRNRLVFIGISVAVLLSLIAGSVAVAVHSKKNNSPKSTVSPAVSLRTVCNVTHYPDSCISSISKLPWSNSTDPVILFKLSLKVVVDELNTIADLPRKLAEGTDDEGIKSALAVCENMFDVAIDRVNETISAIDVGDVKNILSPLKIDDLRMWLSAAVIYHDTCHDALDETEFGNSTISRELKSAMVNSIEFTSNSLAIVAKILTPLSDFGIPNHQRRLLSAGVRRLLQMKNLTPNVTVAADGSGDVKTVNEAVARVPIKGTTVFVIYVKTGTYVEKVRLDKHKWNVMIYGDGMYKTIISGSDNWGKKKTKTFETATLGVQGKGFMMKDIGIINTAGPEKGQAVAFRTDSHQSVFYQCSFDGFQDTLYPHANRQFYRNCDITGTVDFIFGGAAAVFQRCNIRPRQPLHGQSDTITAWKGNDTNLKTGISIQRCIISGNGDLTAELYLGRPWNNLSTTVIMQSVIGPINPAGWLRWNSSVEPPPSIFYGEYKNTGPGSDVTNRVKWPGYRPYMSHDEVDHFTVGNFIQGADWLPATGVPYELS